MVITRENLPEPEGSLVYREAVADARNSSMDVLCAGIDLFASIVHDADAHPFERFNATERHRAYAEELDRRERIARLAAGQGTLKDRNRAAWTQLAQLVKERTSVPELLELTGISVTRTGRNRRSGANEYHSACPLCRDGVDRLVSWDGSNGRVWCRQCQWSTDAIGVASLFVGGRFRDRVEFLAGLVGKQGVPDGR